MNEQYWNWRPAVTILPRICHILSTWGLFQLEKSLSPIDRKRLYIINLNFFVWRHECQRILLKFWLKQFFSCLTPNWNSPLIFTLHCQYWPKIDLVISPLYLIPTFCIVSLLHTEPCALVTLPKTPICPYWMSRNSLFYHY